MDKRKKEGIQESAWFKKRLICMGKICDGLPTHTKTMQ